MPSLTLLTPDLFPVKGLPPARVSSALSPTCGFGARPLSGLLSPLDHRDVAAIDDAFVHANEKAIRNSSWFVCGGHDEAARAGESLICPGHSGHFVVTGFEINHDFAPFSNAICVPWPDKLRR
jgi:hypothetical protein